MKLFHKSKDGGPDSNVTGYWLIESKSLFSIVLLRFKKGSREAFHTHAFHAISWILKGKMREDTKFPDSTNMLVPSILPLFTPRERLHKVTGIADDTWAVSFRGPWNEVWYEYFSEGRWDTLTNGRKIIRSFYTK